MLKRILLIVLLISFSPFLFSFIVKEKKQKAFKTIIIDAGHGGSDGGAKGSYSHEKDICLDIALKLGALLQKELPDVKILYTRVTDVYPELHARANFANQNKGDLFISIHVNAAPAIRHREFTGNKMVTTYVGKGKKKRKVKPMAPLSIGLESILFRTAVSARARNVTRSRLMRISAISL